MSHSATITQHSSLLNTSAKLPDFPTLLSTLHQIIGNVQLVIVLLFQRRRILDRRISADLAKTAEITTSEADPAMGAVVAVQFYSVPTLPFRGFHIHYQRYSKLDHVATVYEYLRTLRLAKWSWNILAK